ncbi:MAG: sigma-70 family RNA polymerase sigma factor [Kiritimatiellia bacterium]
MAEGDEREDAELLSAYLKGDGAAFDLLFARHRDALYSYFRYHLDDVSAADDLFQEVWRRVIRHASRFKAVSFKAWLWRIARNLLIDRIRRSKPTLSLDAPSGGGEAETAPMGEFLPSEESGPLQRLVDRETGEAIRRALSILTPRQRDVFLLRTESQLSFKEVADLLNIPLNTALGCMRDAMLKLRAHLEKELNR